MKTIWLLLVKLKVKSVVFFLRHTGIVKLAACFRRSIFDHLILSLTYIFMNLNHSNATFLFGKKNNNKNWKVREIPRTEFKMKVGQNVYLYIKRFTSFCFTAATKQLNEFHHLFFWHGSWRFTEMSRIFMMIVDIKSTQILFCCINS